MTTNLLDAIGCPRVKQRERPSSVLCETMGGPSLPSVGPMLPPPASCQANVSQCGRVTGCLSGGSPVSERGLFFLVFIT